MNIWRLPYEREALGGLSPAEVVAAVWVRRMFIRFHRDQRGDDRCWLDDWFVWQLLSDTPHMPRYTAEQGMTECGQYWANRNASDTDTAPRGFIADPDLWDNDLWVVSGARLFDELCSIQEAIRVHRDITGRPRTADDDRALYDVLPEGVPADFRLPPIEEFLGEKRAPVAGCPSFWRSHGGCTTTCNLHRWGPCAPRSG